MAEETGRRIVLAARPIGEPKDGDFRLEEYPLPAPGEGQMLLRSLYLSLDPYMRGRMNAGPSYAASVELGQPMTGRSVGQVVASKHASFRPGDFVFADIGWQSHGLSDGQGARKLDPAQAPISTALGVLGMPGLTAYVGLLDLGQPKAGETVVVSAATGAVGSLVGQLAKLKGCRAIGIAGGQAKCDYAVKQLGYDLCLDHRANDLPGRLANACPQGIDIYFENVGGQVLEAVLPLMNTFGRIPLCGQIASYNATQLPQGPDKLPLLMRLALFKRLTIRGFIISDHGNRAPDFFREVGGHLRAGRVKHREDIVEGLENAVRAFQGLLKGANFGKLLVRVSPDPTRG